MTFDGGKAWNDTVTLLAANRSVVAVVAGVFFFLPYFALMLFLPDFASLDGGEPPAETPEQAMAQLSALGPRFFFTMIVLGLVQAVGVMGLLRLLTDRDRPTVGEALASGIAMLIPYILTQILQALLFVAVLGIPAGILIAVGNPGATALAIVLLIAGILYLFARFSLVSPVIAIDRVTNPLAALQHSWALTRGSTARLLVFYFLLFLALAVIFIVASIVFGLIFALAGETVAQIGNGLVASATNAIWVAVFMAVLAAVHRQLKA